MCGPIIKSVNKHLSITRSFRIDCRAFRVFNRHEKRATQLFGKLMIKKIFKMKKVQFVIAISILLFSACKKDDVYNTDHPEHGKITLTTDWSQIGEGVTVPQTYVVRVNDYSTTVSGHTNTIDNLFLPNTYNTYVYNIANKITVSETTATLAVSNNIADPMPEWFFSSALSLTIEQDKDHHFTAIMQQQVRELNFVITPSGGTPDRIESITATLSGVASSLDFANNAHSNAASVVPVFTKQDDGNWLATVRLLGITSNEQKLSLTIAFADNSPATINTEVDIHTELGDFNTDKRTPLTLGAQVVETSTEAGFAATITDWTEVTEQINVN